MAKIVDVTDVPELPGAGMLHFDDGRPPLMALPEIANEHRDRLGLNAMDNGVAGPGSGTPDGYKDRYGTFHPAADPNAGFPVEHTNRWGGKFTTREETPPSVDITPKGGQTPAAPAAPVTAPPPAPVPQQGAGGAPPGIAAPPEPVDPAQAAQDERLRQIQLTGKLPGTGGGGPARPAGFSPDLKKVVTEAGPAYDPRAAAERLDAGNDVLNAQLAKAATEKQTADAMAARAAAQNLQAQQHLGNLAHDTAVKTANFQAREKGFQNDLERYTQSAAPDPNHFIASRGVVANIFGAIGQGLGAFGSSLNHTQNYAFDYVQAQIKQDIAQQEERYKAGRADRNDALARFVDNYHGDMEMAKAAMLQAQNKVAETETNNFAAQSQSKEVSANAQVLAAQFQQQQLLAEQQRAELAQGTTKTTSEEKYHQASGGAGGGKPLTLEQELALDKFNKGKGTPALSATGEARQKANYGTKIEGSDRYSDALSHEAELMGVKFDPDTGTIVDPKTGKPATSVDVPVGAGYVGRHLPDAITPSGATALQRARANSAALRSSVISGKPLSAEEAEKEANQTQGRSESEILDSLRQRAHEQYAARRSLDATAASIDPNIVNSRAQGQRDVNLSRATGKPLPEPRRGAPASDAGEPESESP